MPQKPAVTPEQLATWNKRWAYLTLDAQNIRDAKRQIRDTLEAHLIGEIIPRMNEELARRDSRYRVSHIVCGYLLDGPLMITANCRATEDAVRGNPDRRHISHALAEHLAEVLSGTAALAAFRAQFPNAKFSVESNYSGGVTDISGICPEHREDFILFAEFGDVTESFQRHLGTCKNCNVADEREFTRSAEQLEDFARVLHEKKDKPE